MRVVQDYLRCGLLEHGLARQPAARLAQWRKVADEALRPQRELAAAVLRELPAERRTLTAFPDEREVALGLFSRERQALVFERTYTERASGDTSRAGHGPGPRP